MCNCNNSLANILNNLFGTPCGCQNGNNGNGCGCQNSNNSSWNNFQNGFISGVNAVNASNGNGCGCNQNSDNYYARQYALGPYAQNSGCGCGS